MKSEAQEVKYPSVEAMKAAVELEIHAVLGYVPTVVIGQMIQKVLDAASPPSGDAVREALERAKNVFKTISKGLHGNYASFLDMAKLADIEVEMIDAALSRPSSGAGR